MKFRAVHKLLMENHYEILMVEAGVEKIYVPHLETPIGAQKPRLNLWLGFVEGSLNRNFRQYGELKSRCIAQQSSSQVSRQKMQ